VKQCQDTLLRVALKRRRTMQHTRTWPRIRVIRHKRTNEHTNEQRSKRTDARNRIWCI